MKTLTDALDINLDFSKSQGLTSPYVLWQSEGQNPYGKQDRSLNQKEQLIVQETNAKMDPRFSQESSATKGIAQLYFQFAGYIAPKPAANPELEFEPLVNSGLAGRIQTQVLMRANSPEAIERERGSQNNQYVIAAHIKGKNASAEINPETKPAKANTNVIYVADVDTLSDFFIRRRAEPVDNGVEYFFQNVSFFLNIVDTLAGVEEFAELRTRKINHVTLEVVEKTYQKSMAKVYKKEQELLIEFQNEKNKAEEEARKSILPIQNKIKPLAQLKQDKKPYDASRLLALQSRLEQEAREQEARIKKRTEELENDRNEEKREIELIAELEIQEIQRRYKIAAVLIPPIPPLLVGIFVATRRRLREREGISKARRLK
jgi:ABC-2 type transport system permease protein